MTIAHASREVEVNRSPAFEVKGWCPGALRPMQSGDGLIVRVRPPLNALTTDEWLALADAAARFGNGHLDLTRRANLQIRGVREEALPDLYEVIGGLGLLDNNPESEAVRNVVINPLAGIDPLEMLDVRNIARELSDTLASEPPLWELPGKFGFVVDGGGALRLSGQRADIRLTAMRQGPGVVIAIGLDRQAGIDWLGSVLPAHAAHAAIDAARAFLEIMPLDSASPSKRSRMRDLSNEKFSAVRAVIRSQLDPLTENPSTNDASTPGRVGLLELGLDRFAVGIAAPFGGIDAAQLRQLVNTMTNTGVREIRLSAWRTLYAVAPDRRTGRALLNAAKHRGFVISPNDPLLRIEACPGAPACPSTRLDTRGDARRLSELLPRSILSGTVHVSGCAKGCAKSGASDLVLVGDEGSYGIVVQGTTHDRPRRRATFSEIASDLDAILLSANGS